MKKGLLLACALCAGSIGSAFGVATNYALTLAADGSVNCGHIHKLDGASNYTIQLWFNPTQWNEGAKLLSAGSDWSLALGPAGTLVYTAGGSSADITSPDLKAGAWCQLTLIADKDAGKAIVNGGTPTTLAKLPAIAASNTDLTIGGGFDGRIDEVRLWSNVLSSDFDYFIKNTLNRWIPQLGDLAAYYKFDQADCPQVVEQTAIWADNTTDYNNHGLISGTVSKEAVADNVAMRYRINGAYTENSRFYDRAIPADQYLLSNDLIILGISGSTDGHLDFTTPNNHLTNNGAQWMADFDGRQGVMSFDGSATMSAEPKTFNPIKGQYLFESFIFIDEWVEGAYIFRKETADGTKGISLRLGTPEKKEMLIRVNGHTYGVIQSQSKIDTGKWFHFATYPNANPNSARFTYNFYVDGNYCMGSSGSSDSEIYLDAPAGAEDRELVLGEGFKGKLDETAFWLSNSQTGFASHMANGLPMPGIGVTQTADVMFNAEAYYRFDKESEPGFDSYSQDSWLEIMKSPYEGYTGYEVRISVKSWTGWESTIQNATYRTNFARDLARLAEKYDGVEFDLEWVYGSGWNTVALLVDECRALLPADKSFMVSCHNVTYNYPKDKMGALDGFTFQQYGPQNVHFGYNHFVNMCNSFVNYGFDRNKIVTSYSTTTSKGFQNGTAVTPIKGVRNGFFDDGFVNKGDTNFKTIDGYDYYFCDPLQTYKRARFSADQDFGGIFYWDMGNDVPVENPYNMAKWCSYGLNSNVEKHVTKVDIIRTSGIDNVTASGTDGAPAISRQGDTIIADGTIEIVTPAGVTLAVGKGSLNIAALTTGIYIARCGKSTLKFVK